MTAKAFTASGLAERWDCAPHTVYALISRGLLEVTERMKRGDFLKVRPTPTEEEE